ncbi:MAG: hypothetical protein MUE54_06380 [Anaerolineae bacterium]|jgi:hypothetical protein|nr:hypothetical protein [Anaerolineae bacterium]
MEKRIFHGDYGLIVEWWHDDMLCIIRGSGDMSRSALDYWGDHVIQSIQTFPEHSPIFMLFDLTSPTQGFTPYSRTVIDRITHAAPKHRQIYVGIFMHEGIISRILSFYVNSRDGKNLHLRMFFDEQKTLEWLQLMMKQHGALDEDDGVVS